MGALPPVERRRRGAETAGPVDGGRTTNAASLKDVDRLVGCLARGRLLIKLRVGLGLLHLEIAGGAQRAFFDNYYLEASAGQQFGGDAATGTAADDGNIRFKMGVGGQCAGIDMLPATRQAFAKWVTHHCTLGGPG